METLDRRPLGVPTCVLLGAALVGMGLVNRGLAQEGTLDVLDGETLYEGGWLFTLGYSLKRKERLFSGEGSVSDPLHRRESEQTVAMAGHYGLRHDLQLSAIVPYVYKERTLKDPAGPDHLAADGLGDITGVAKWRFFRWDAPHRALNLAVLAGLKCPTGSHREHDHGQRLDPELQPGTGSWDPLGAAAVTYEPYRWRFSGFALYKYASENSDGFKFGNQLFAELAMGNRFWLEPYPGPFLRADLFLRYRGEERARQDGLAVDLGGDLLTVGINLAFRPQPALDFQVAVEVPVYERVNGLQLAQQFSASLALGYRF